MTRHLPTEERRAQILDAARHCMLDRGYHATRVSEIAETAGLSKGAVYFHFENKRALLDALVEDELRRSLRILDEAEDENAGNPLLALARAFVGFLGEPDDPRHRFFVLTGELAMHDEVLRERLFAHHALMLERISELIARWSESAGVDVADPEGLAHLVTAMANGLQGAWAAGYPFDPERLLMVAIDLTGGGLREGLRRVADGAAAG